MDDFPIAEENRTGVPEFSLAPEIGTTAGESKKEYEYETSKDDSKRKKRRSMRSFLIQAAGVMVAAVLVLDSFGVDHLALNSLFGGLSPTPVTPTPVTPGGLTPTNPANYDIDPVPSKISKWPSKYTVRVHVTYLDDADTYDSPFTDDAAYSDAEAWVLKKGGAPDKMVLVKAKNHENGLQKSDDAILSGSLDSPESIVLFGGELWWDYDRDLYYEASAADVSTADSFPKLPNTEPDFLGNYAWAGMGSEEYLVVDSTYLHAGTYYTSNGVVPKNLPGAVYDKASNTLTLENFHGSFIDANLMGNGFKVKLVGSNSLDTIKMWGAMYGGSITFTGDGSITLNQELKYDSGLYLECENSPSAVLIDREATVEVYGEAAVMIHATQLETAVYMLNPIVMTGGRYADGEFVKYRVNVTDSAGNIVFDEDGNPVLTDWTVKDIAREQGIDLYDYSIVGTDGEPSGHVLFRPIKE